MRLLAAAALLIQPTATMKTVGIVGAGPAGLTLAVALNRALPDVAVTIFDRSDSCRPALGGGVQLNSGAAVLARLDPAIGAAVAKLGQPVRRVRSRTAGGDALLDLDLAAAIRGDARAPLRVPRRRVAAEGARRAVRRRRGVGPHGLVALPFHAVAAVTASIATPMLHKRGYHATVSLKHRKKNVTTNTEWQQPYVVRRAVVKRM